MRPARSTRKPRTTDKRDRMLLAARELLREKRFDDVTIPDLARAAGVAVGTFYLYFKGKTEILDALAVQFRSELATAIRPLLDSGAALRDILEPLLDRLQQVASGYRDVIHLFGSDALYFTDLADTQDQIQMLRDRVERERDEGLLPSTINPVVVADLLDALTARMLRGRMRGADAAESEAYRSETLRLMLHLLS
jgi:AcrR family transcriptional regulator